METKYGFSFSKEEINKEAIRLTNQIWKLIPMKENNEPWVKQLETVIVNIAGMSEIFPHNSHFLQLLSGLEGLRVTDVEFATYRKIVFECISLLNDLEQR